MCDKANARYVCVVLNIVNITVIIRITLLKRKSLLAPNTMRRMRFIITLLIMQVLNYSFKTVESKREYFFESFHNRDTLTCLTITKKKKSSY